MGAEVIETKDNWNYSRGLLFTYAIPFYHFGVRAKYAFNDKYSLTGFLVNGWNNVVDNNSGKTYGVAVAGLPRQKSDTITIKLSLPGQKRVTRLTDLPPVARSTALSTRQ